MKNRSFAIIFFIMCFVSLSTSPLLAHFGMVIPTDSMVMQDDSRSIQLELSFSHPFEQVGMPLVKPKVFKVFSDWGETNLKPNLKRWEYLENSAWKADYKIKRPGVYHFYMEPQPYWEPVEDSFIIHYTKTVVTAFGMDEGWDKELGLKTEIVPLSKPYGLYSGNLFQGIVKLNGKIVPFSEVEVEYLNTNSSAKAPTEYMITQTIKCDANGVFSYVAPVSGWWGFAALNTADYTIKFNGQNKAVELGAVLWVKFQKWQTQ